MTTVSKQEQPTAQEIVLTAKTSASTDARKTGLNNNVLVLGCSGSGKTRNHLIPNLLQEQGSCIVLDSKGALYDELGAYLALEGFLVDQIDFSSSGSECSTLGYDPLDHVRMTDGKPNQLDIISVASAICPADENQSDPFWSLAAANYLSSFIAYVFEALPQKDWHMDSVISFFESGSGKIDQAFLDLETQNPDSFAVSLYHRARVTRGAEKMHSSIMGIIAADLMPFGFDGARKCFRKRRHVDFAEMGRTPSILFVTIDDFDHSTEKLTNLFVQQAFTQLCDSADHDYPTHQLPVGVRLVLDDFANLKIPHIDDVLAVVRSRNISFTLICQTVSQLVANYGDAQANSIIGNCDRQMLLAVQDMATAEYFAPRANKPACRLLETPLGTWWLFERGKRGVAEPAYQVERHPNFGRLRQINDFMAEVA